ncbi:MAG: tetratricopeptide repeat protein [Chthoniobacterales bacterium]|nr:tetratricopeptide repeat protein [Chthoniobacterales bacterium]
MKKIGLILLAGFSLFFAAPVELLAQTDDPSETFLKAYMTSQQGERLEHENQFKAALVKFRFAGTLLEELRKRHAGWQPAIVEYRARKVGEGILRVQNKIGTEAALAATAEASPVLSSSAVPASSPLLPQNAGPAEPSVDIGKARVGEARLPVAQQPSDNQALVAAPASPASEATIKEATRKLQEKVDQLEAELQKSRKDFSYVQREKETLTSRLEETSSKLERAQSELQKTQGAEKQARDQLAQAQESLKKIQSSGSTDAKAADALRAEISQLKNALASAEQGRAAAEKEKDAASARLTEADAEIASVRKERDELITQLQNAGEAQQRVQVLVAETSDLTKKLANAEKTVREITDDRPKKEQEIADVRRQVEQLRQQLANSQKQNKDFEVTVADLRSQLEQAGAELDKAKLTGANPEETARLTKENEMLRNIVMRQRQEEARRDQARKLMLAEFDKLQIKSQTLDQQIDLLAQPVTKLSAEELALLRAPIVATSDSNPNVVTASFAMAKEGRPENATPAPTATPRAGNSAPVPGPNVETSFRPSVPEELVPLAKQAKQNFDAGKFRSSEKLYDRILAKSPNNLYALSNLGAVYYRTGRLKAAELTLKKAVTLAPNDEFSRRTLGIVYYRQSKFDEAVAELTKALAINPKSFIAHNYLGITASEKGWQEAAEKEMLQAIAANPDYVDAHYNLAVIYVTNKPPAKELAKQHYAKAVELGAEANPSLEQMLR